MKKALHRAGLLALALALAACSRVTAENYARIKVGMTFEEVKSVLGSPDRCSDVMGAKSCMWGNDARYIRVNFIGDQAVIFNAENLR
jgi:hypothetical protein